jgi:hypothetical protein
MMADAFATDGEERDPRQVHRRDGIARRECMAFGHHCHAAQQAFLRILMAFDLGSLKDAVRFRRLLVKRRD